MCKKLVAESESAVQRIENCSILVSNETRRRGVVWIYPNLLALRRVDCLPYQLKHYCNSVRELERLVKIWYDIAIAIRVKHAKLRLLSQNASCGKAVTVRTGSDERFAGIQLQDKRAYNRICSRIECAMYFVAKLLSGGWKMH